MSFVSWGIQIWSGVTVGEEQLSRTGIERLSESPDTREKSNRKKAHTENWNSAFMALREQATFIAQSFSMIVEILVIPESITLRDHLSYSSNSHRNGMIQVTTEI